MPPRAGKPSLAEHRKALAGRSSEYHVRTRAKASCGLRCIHLVEIPPEVADFGKVQVHVARNDVLAINRSGDGKPGAQEPQQQTSSPSEEAASRELPPLAPRQHGQRASGRMLRSSGGTRLEFRDASACIGLEVTPHRTSQRR